MPPSPPTKARQITAWIVVVVTVLAVWAYVDYRNQAPKATQPVTSDK
jgi:hypothetical protein